jgi:hypothetical protein
MTAPPQAWSLSVYGTIVAPPLGLGTLELQRQPSRPSLWPKGDSPPNPGDAPRLHPWGGCVVGTGAPFVRAFPTVVGNASRSAAGRCSKWRRTEFRRRTGAVGAVVARLAAGPHEITRVRSNA